MLISNKLKSSDVELCDFPSTIIPPNILVFCLTLFSIHIYCLTNLISLPLLCSFMSLLSGLYFAFVLYLEHKHFLINSS